MSNFVKETDSKSCEISPQEIMILVRTFLNVYDQNDRSNVLKNFRGKTPSVVWIRGKGDLDGTSHIMRRVNTTSMLEECFREKRRPDMITYYQDCSQIPLPCLRGFGVLHVGRRLYFAHSNFSRILVSDEIWKILGYILNHSDFDQCMKILTEKNEEKKRHIVRELFFFPKSLIGIIHGDMDNEVLTNPAKPKPTH